MATIKKDIELLQALSLNARASLAELSKQLKVSKQTLSYRLKILTENKTLLGTHAIINTYALGDIHFRLFIKLHNITSEQEEELYKNVHSNPKVSWYALCDGDYDLAIIVWAKSIVEYEEIYKELMKSYSKYFRTIQFSVATEINYYKHNFLNNGKDTKSHRFGTTNIEHKLDEIDKTILLELNKNARINIIDIANKKHINAKLIHDRIKRMQKNNIILGFNTKINHKKLGFTHRKVQLWLNDTSEKTIQKLISYLKMQPTTIFTVFSIGGCDLEFELMTKTNEEYYTIMKKLRATFPQIITNYENFIIIEEPKTGFIY